MTERKKVTLPIFSRKLRWGADHLAHMLRLSNRIFARPGRHGHDFGGRQPGDDHVGV